MFTFSDSKLDTKVFLARSVMLHCNKDAKMDIGVIYNCNYATRADVANAVKVANFFADGQPGKWYLDHTEWQWTNVDVPTTSAANAMSEWVFVRRPEYIPTRK